MDCGLWGDDAVRTLTAADAVRAMREAVLAAYAGQISAPARVRVELSDLDYVFTVGAVAGGPTGFRAYRAGTPAGDQLVAVWDAAGRLTGVIVGDELGARRTGALGAVAADALARHDSHAVAVIGSGRQAWTQLWALTAVRDIRSARIFSPQVGRRRWTRPLAGLQRHQSPPPSSTRVDTRNYCFCRIASREPGVISATGAAGGSRPACGAWSHERLRGDESEPQRQRL
jgi:hypothetical protein